MFDNIRKLKLNSRAIIMMSRWQPVFIAALYSVILLVLSYIALNAGGYLQALTDYTAAIQAGDTQAELVLPAVEAMDLVIVYAALLLIRFVEAGFNIAMLMLSRGRLARSRDLMNGFTMPFKVLVITVSTTIITTIGYMLFVVPGVVLGYKYRYAIQVLYDDPTLGPFKAMSRASRLVKGHKMEMFLLDISFYPWRIASSLVALVFSFAILDAWVLPYTQLAFSVKYNLLSGWEPSEADNQADNYIIWAKAQPAAQPTDAQPVDAAQPAPETAAVHLQTEAQPTAEAGVHTADSSVQPEDKAAPDIEYWKARAIQLQKEMQEKSSGQG